MEAPLVVIVGPTASGKSNLVIDVAEVFGGEIICADSRTIYKGMDIGTAKPSRQDQARVPHYGLDLVEPGERFTAADFKRYANETIATIRNRGKVPILVGGTGLYVDAVVFDYTFIEPDYEQKTKLEAMNVNDLYKYCHKNNISLPENKQNKRHLINAILRGNNMLQKRERPLKNTIIVGIATDKEVLRQRIHLRSEQIFESGAIEEAHSLARKYGWESEAMTGNIYRLVKQLDDGLIDEAQLKRLFETSDWQLAKRQLTWLKRNQFIQWHSLSDAKTYLENQLHSLVQP